MCLVPCSRVVLMRTQHVEYSSYNTTLSFGFPTQIEWAILHLTSPPQYTQTGTSTIQPSRDRLV